ncbi:uncharacterized protein LOC115695405 [Cannabis sativa]|uniref:uncharacterized protein LOC115695405 n=1 Tax=Cannabis sativa TaxID=3483 RepID=UPI0029CA4483|nr:uncharacterized protein LOC115695405 [Cannabis sativa]
MRDVKRVYGIELSYEKAWRCREKTLMYVRGRPENSYLKIPSYLYILQQKNPGTITDIVVEDDRFKYCFFSLGACRRGFSFCRPVISIDGTCLETKYGGIMLCVVTLDANNQLFPIAFGIVDSENNDSWTYFLLKLKEAIGEVHNLVFVSNGHQSIEHVIDVVFPDACHCACYHHIAMNVVDKFKTDACNKQIWTVAYTFSKADFDKEFQKVRKMDLVIAAYLEDIGFEKWARPYCMGDRYNVMTSNTAESINIVTEEAKKFLITNLIKFIRFTLQTWFTDHFLKADKCSTPLTEIFEGDLALKLADAKFLNVQHNGSDVYNVGRCPNGKRGGDVNLVEKTCTCGLFQMIKIPCPHACATAIEMNMSVYALCSPYYTKETWKNT